MQYRPVYQPVNSAGGNQPVQHDQQQQIQPIMQNLVQNPNIFQNYNPQNNNPNEKYQPTVNQPFPENYPKHQSTDFQPNYHPSTNLLTNPLTTQYPISVIENNQNFGQSLNQNFNQNYNPFIPENQNLPSSGNLNEQHVNGTMENYAIQPDLIESDSQSQSGFSMKNFKSKQIILDS